MLLGLLLGKLQARPLFSMLAGGAPTILWLEKKGAQFGSAIRDLQFGICNSKKRERNSMASAIIGASMDGPGPFK